MIELPHRVRAWNEEEDEVGMLAHLGSMVTDLRDEESRCLHVFIISFSGMQVRGRWRVGVNQRLEVSRMTSRRTTN